MSRKRAYFVDNWDLFIEQMRRHPPHRIVHSGNVSLDGADELSKSSSGVCASPGAGYVEWTLDGRSVAHRLVEPPLMMTYDVGAWNAAKGSTTKMPPRPLVRR